MELQSYPSSFPLRTLDTEKEKAIRNFYSSPAGVGLFVGTFLPITFGFSLGGIFWGIGNGLLAGIAVAVCFLLLRWRHRRKKFIRAKFVYQYGLEEELVFSGITNNYSYTVNDQPQQVISLTHNGTPMEIKTFDKDVIKVYTLPRQTAYAHPRYEKVLVPSGLFQVYNTPPKKSVSRVVFKALMFLLPNAFIVGLAYFINKEMSSHSFSYAQPDALFYQQAEKLVLATVVTHFQATEVEGSNISGTERCFAEGVDLRTGKQLWKVDFHARDDNNRDVGGARLLGQSDKYLFFLRNELYVIDKETGKIAARNDDFPGIKDKMLRQPVLSYMNDTHYTYSDSLRVLVIQGADGLFYSIDGLTLQTNTIDISDPNAFFRNRFQFGNNYEDHIASVFDDGHRCMALLDAKDTLLLANDLIGFQGRPARESIRRMLYACPSDAPGSNWTGLDSSVFLFGGFLTDNSQLLHSPVDFISRYAGYQALMERYNNTNPPMRTASEGFLVLHRLTIEPNAILQLTGFSTRGTRLWQVNTGYRELPLLYHDVEKDVLYFSGNTNGDYSDRINQVIGIDLKSGAIQKYDIK